MPIQSLRLSDFRNFTFEEVPFSEGLNIFYGDNGSGKTSLLEAIGFLSAGRSFKTRRPDNVIRFNALEAVVYGRFLRKGITTEVGVLRSKQQGNRVQMDGNLVKSASELAHHFPSQVLDHSTLQLIEGGPGLRRGFLDWILFHVKHQYGDLCKSYQDCLKQRNALLRRDKIDGFELSLWTDHLVSKGSQINALRASTAKRLSEWLSVSLAVFDLENSAGLSIDYHEGFQALEGLEQAMLSSLEKDRLRGFTQVGPHRADLVFRLGRKPVGEIYSRGQIKRLVYALYLARAKWVSEESGLPMCLLLDDLPAELDKNSQTIITNWLNENPMQTFVTGVDKNQLIRGWSQNSLLSAKMFHVKQGTLTEEPINGELHD